MDHALDAFFVGGLEHVAAAVDVGRIDVLRRIQRQRGGRVHDDVHALHGALDRRQVANVALDLRDAAALGVGKIRQVERDDVVPTRQQMARQVNAQKSGSPRNEKAFSRHKSNSFEDDVFATATGRGLLPTAAPRPRSRRRPA